jgi:flagellar biosynthesis/type III secretory pathway protein FliH
MCRMSHEQAHEVQDVAPGCEAEEVIIEAERARQVQAAYDRVARKRIDPGFNEGFKEAFMKAYEKSFKDAYEEGCKEARAEALLHVLARRFGELPESVTARVARARKPTLDRWFERALGAATLRDVFSR